MLTSVTAAWLGRDGRDLLLLSTVSFSPKGSFASHPPQQEPGDQEAEKQDEVWGRLTPYFLPFPLSMPTPLASHCWTPHIKEPLLGKKYLLTDELINKICSVHTVEYYSALKRDSDMLQYG